MVPPTGQSFHLLMEKHVLGGKAQTFVLVILFQQVDICGFDISISLIYTLYFIANWQILVC